MKSPTSAGDAAGRQTRQSADIVTAFKPMITGHLNRTRDGCTARQILIDIGLFEQKPFREMQAADVVDGVKAAGA